jgi:putative ABC transport system permease protein
VAVGAALALLAGQGVASLLYGLEPHDPGALAFAVLLLAGAGLLSAAIPAKRAAGIDPAVTLRAE